jgi:hypothetical protein
VSPIDFYAAAAASFVVILFTKFLAHSRRRPVSALGVPADAPERVAIEEGNTANPAEREVGGQRASDGRSVPMQSEKDLAKGLHWLCVGCAWFGLLLSLFALGNPWWKEGPAQAGDPSGNLFFDRYDEFFRSLVFVAAFIAATILALDIAISVRPPKAISAHDGNDDNDPPSTAHQGPPAADESSSYSPGARFYLDWKFWAEGLVVVVAILALIATAIQAKATTDQAGQTTEQLAATRYQSVYERILDLEKLPIEKSELAPYLIGGSRPPDSAGHGDARRAAVLYALDTYQYVWAQLSPAMPQGQRGGSLVLRDSSIEKPENVSDGDWEAWQTWSETIAGGFRGAPGMCKELVESSAAFAQDFLAAIASIHREEGCTEGEESELATAAGP